MNRWNIPDWLEAEVRERDKYCVYCGIEVAESMLLQAPRKTIATWEHIINDEAVITRENIARCCVANSGYPLYEKTIPIPTKSR